MIGWLTADDAGTVVSGASPHDAGISEIAKRNMYFRFIRTTLINVECLRQSVVILQFCHYCMDMQQQCYLTELSFFYWNDEKDFCL